MIQELLRRHVLFVVLWIIAGIALPFGIREGNDWGGDFAVYISEARNLARHRAFYESSYVHSNASLIHHPARYPPLPSLILAPVYAARGLDYRAMKLVLGTFLWLSLPLYYVIGWRRGASSTMLVCVLLLLLLAPITFTIGQTIGAGFISLFVSTVVVLAVDYVYEKNWDIGHPITAGTAIGIGLFLCYLTRPDGLALIGGFGAGELFRFRRLRMFSLATGGVLGSSIGLYLLSIRGAPPLYGSNFSLEPRLWYENAAAYSKVFATIWAGSPAAVRYPLALAALCLAIIGISRRLRRPTFIEFYLCLWLMALMAYSSSDMRYMLPLLPFLLMYGAEALAVLTDKVKTALPARAGFVRAGVVVCLGVALIASAANLRMIQTGPISEGVSQPSFIELCEFLKRETPDDGLILSWNPRVFALYTNKRSAMYPNDIDPAGFERKLPNGRSRLLVFYNQDLDRAVLGPYLERAGTKVSRLFENADFKVFALPDTP